MVNRDGGNFVVPHVIDSMNTMLSLILLLVKP